MHVYELYDDNAMDTIIMVNTDRIIAFFSLNNHN